LHGVVKVAAESVAVGNAWVDVEKVSDRTGDMVTDGVCCDKDFVLF